MEKNEPGKVEGEMPPRIADCGYVGLTRDQQHKCDKCKPYISLIESIHLVGLEREHWADEIQRLRTNNKWLSDLATENETIRAKDLSRIGELEAMVEKAGKLLAEGKAKFAPNTTNSFVDEWLSDFSKLKEKNEK